MDRFYAIKAFQEPADYKIPSNEELKFDTSHPELNSLDYLSTYKPPDNYLPVYSCIRQNDQGLFIIASNEFTTNVNGGFLAGDYDFNNFATSNVKEAKFSIVHKNNLLDLYYLNDITFMATTSNNSIELYSTKPAVKLEQNYHHENFCFMKLNSKTLDGRVNCLSQFFEKKSFICGTSTGHFECYDYDAKTIFQSFRLPFGHAGEITGVSAHPTVDLNWASTSTDMSCLLWDRRLVLPATALIDKHHSQLTDVKWIQDEILILSDSSGNLMVFDIRNTENPLSNTKVSNKPISSLNFHKSEKMFGVISESCCAYIYEIDENNGLKLIHEHNANPYILYSLCFDVKKPNTYYVVGQKKYAKELTFTQDE